MKLAKSFATILLLVLLLPLSSLAGDLQTPGCAQPSSPVTLTDTKTTTDSQSETCTTTSSTTYDSLLIEGMLALIGTF